MKCTKKECQTYQLIRTGNPFFTYTNFIHKQKQVNHTLYQPFYW